METHFPQEAVRLARQCRHYAMCKIDYLGTGVCASGRARHFVAFYPQGRMDIYAALAVGSIPVTPALVEIAESCDLCGICDRQCHFYTGMRPSRVMAALKRYVDAYRRDGGRIEVPPADETLRVLHAIVGRDWASNDPAILVTYSHDPSPLGRPVMPRYVVLPGTADEVSGIVKLARQKRIPFLARGNGGSTAGFAFTDGIMIDLNRMRGIEFDPDNWIARVEAGVTSYDLQREARRRGLRINAAEPAATVCGNIICSGTFSTWGNAYGTAGDNAVDAEFVAPGGGFFRLTDRDAPNLFGFRKADAPSPGICVRADVRLHPVTGDEEGLLVPFASFAEAVRFSRELSMRRIGLAVAVLGAHYISAFISPTEDLADQVRPALTELTGIEHMVLVLGDRYAREAVKAMGVPVIDNALFRLLALGLPRLASPEWQFLIRDLDWNHHAFEVLVRDELRPLLEMILSPSPATLASAVDEPDLRTFYEELYGRPEMTDLVWLNTFRIVSARMSRRKHMVALILYLPLDKQELIEGIIADFAQIAERHGITHDYGFLTPMDLGKRAILEYDYYADQTDEADQNRVREAMASIVPMIEGLYRNVKGVAWMKHIVSQGFARKESIFYT